jgi:hypothetical protein
MELELGDLQLDSYSETAASPVLLYAIRNPPQKDKDKEKDKEKEKEKKEGEEGEGSDTGAREKIPRPTYLDPTMAGAAGAGARSGSASGSGSGSGTGAGAGAGAGGTGGEEKKEDSPEKLEPVLKCSIIHEQDPVSGTPHFKYIAVRLLELVVSVDYASLQLIVLDLGADFSYVSRNQQLALRSPERWAEEYCMSVFAPEKRLQTIDVYKTQVRIMMWGCESLGGNGHKDNHHIPLTPSFS